MAGFTKRYGIKTLVWYEMHDDKQTAYEREARIKRWKRAWKLNLIEDSNPYWEDLFEEIAHD